MDDSTEDVPMTPDVIAQQNPDVHNFMGLSLSPPPPWDNASQNTAQEEKAARQHKNKREMLAQRQREDQERSQRQDAFDRKYRSYTAALATEDYQAQMKGEPMDPDTMASMLHMGLDSISGGGAGSMISGIVSEDVAKGEDGGQSPEENVFSARPAPQRPLQD